MKKFGGYKTTYKKIKGQYFNKRSKFRATSVFNCLPFKIQIRDKYRRRVRLSHLLSSSTPNKTRSLLFINAKPDGRTNIGK